MAKSSKINSKKRSLMPTSGRAPHVAARFPPALIDAVNAYAAETDGGITRSEAIRRLIVSGLEVLKAR